MNRESPYRNIASSVRTPRYAVFINNNDKYWRTYIDGIIQCFSQVWGGEYFLIIPTDGKTIDDKFWEILEAYSPDKLGKYVPNLNDLREADPKQFELIKEQHRKAWDLQDEKEFEKTWEEQVKQSHYDSLQISNELSEELKNRLSPFYFADHIISENTMRDSPLGFPFTEIIDIVDNAKEKPTKIAINKQIKSPEFRLMVSSRAGIVSRPFRDKLKDIGFSEIAIPAGFRDKDLVIALEKGEYDLKLQKSISESLGHDTSRYPQEDFLPHLPFKLSMLKLGKFYRLDIHREEEENLVVVIGNEITNFCLYYCLSRMHDGVYWLPETFLKKAAAKSIANQKRDKEKEEPKKYTETEELAASLVMAYFAKISYGYNQKQIDITSASLTVSQLEDCKTSMGVVNYLRPNELLNHIAIKPLEDLSVKCVVRRIELNNYANQQDMIFQNSKSVGRVNTPKPKNFNYINPSTHRWITSLEIDGYYPPSLPFLGQEIIKLRNSSYETRVAKDGIAYLSPNIGHFGEDIDNNLVRPELYLLPETEIFKQYFNYSGYSMELSDKGSYLKDTISRFGSLEEVAKFFRSEAKRQLFDLFLIDKKDSTDEVIYLDIEKRSYLSFEAIKDKLANEEEAVNIIEDLISKDILSRGLIFQCSRCRLSAWYGIEAVSKTFKCNRCGLDQTYSIKNWKSPAEPGWYYHLAETVYLFYQSNSHITALSLDKLRQESKVAFHYICETDIINVLGENKKRELDILAISDGNIIIGECKNTKPKTSDVTTYATLLSKLTIEPSQFVIATTEDSVSQDVSNALQKMKNTRALVKNDLFGNR